jgi:rod shape-determining protein MreB
VRSAIQGPLFEIVDAIKDTLEQTPPELTGDIAQEGIMLAGGGTLLTGFAELVAAETGLPTFPAKSPLTCVVAGSGRALADFDRLQPSARRSNARFAGVASPRADNVLRN